MNLVSMNQGLPFRNSIVTADSKKIEKDVSVQFFDKV
jgi:hypothetical protein